MIVGGLGTLGWAVTVWQWQDPFTAAYTKWEQHKLTSRLEKQTRAFALSTPRRTVVLPARGAKLSSAALAAERRAVAVQARRYAQLLHEGDPVGKLSVPRLGLGIVVVDGTSHDSLAKGPGRYRGAGMPGEGRLVYIAGHRTTYLAPFSHIDALRPGDPVTLTLPYATFHYAITVHRIVAASDLDVLRARGREELVLQACHPRFFATQRYLAYARLVRIEPLTGVAFTVAGGHAVAAPAPLQTSLR